MNIGVLGGTFDPIHVGHLALAEEVRDWLELAEVLFMPAGLPYQKANTPILAAEHRVEMVRLATIGKPYFSLSTMEIERAGPTYTVDTISELKSQLGKENELFFILGWDSLKELPKWHEPKRLISLCRLAAVPRVGCLMPDLESLEAEVPGLSERVVMLGKPEIDISASVIRERVARDLSIKHLVPEVVAKYIREQGLYSAGNQSASRS